MTIKELKLKLKDVDDKLEIRFLDISTYTQFKLIDSYEDVLYFKGYPIIIIEGEI